MVAPDVGVSVLLPQDFCLRLVHSQRAVYGAELS